MNLIFYLVLNIVVLYTAVYYNSRSMFFVLLALLIIPVFSAGIALCAALKTRAHLEAFENEDQSFNLHLKITNLSPVSAPCLKYKVVCKNSFGTYSQTMKIDTDAAAKKTSTVIIPIKPTRCGLYSAGISRCHAKDFFGLFPLFTSRDRDETEMLIMPKLTFLDIDIKESTAFFISDSDEYDKEKKGEDYSETFEVREYRPGDKLSRIHWKISTGGKLMVKEGSTPLGCSVLLIADLRYADESFFEGLFSVSATLCAKLCPHYLSWYSAGDMRRVKITSAEDIYAAAAQIFKAGDCRGNYYIDKLYKHEYQNSEIAATIKFADGLYVDDKALIKGSGFEEKLRRMTIEI